MSTERPKENPGAGGNDSREAALPEDVEDRLEAIAERYLEALRAGETPPLDEVLTAHQDIANLLEGRLRLVELLHAAASPAEREAMPSPGGTSPPPSGSALHIRCPHCRHVVELGASAPAIVVCSSCGSSFRLDESPRAGALAGRPDAIGRFRILEVLGRGAFGLVYKAFDPELDRVVTLKVPRAGTFADREEAERFLREARSAALLRHPGIIQVHEVALDGDTPFIVREYVEGRTLAAAAAEERPGFRETAEIVAAVAEALDYAHRHGVVHRDIKPENIILDEAGRPHLSDFGLARRREGEVTVTLDGQILGTPAYMSPEQALGRHELVDGRSDVYGLGVILYELLTGERPFTGQRSMVLHQVVHEEPRAPRRLNAHIPRALETICRKAMAKELGRRYPSAEDLAADLRRFIDGHPIAARPPGALERARLWCRRNPVVAGLAATISCLLVAGTVASIWAALSFEHQAREERHARVEATRRLAHLDTAAGARLFDEGETLLSLPYLAAAVELDRGNPALERAHRVRIGCVLARCPRLLQLWFHDGPVNDARFSAGGRLVVTASADRTARVWRTDTGAPAGPALEHPAAVTAAALGPRGDLILTACADGRARLWNRVTGTRRGGDLAHDRAVLGASFSPDGTQALTFSRDGTARVWRLADGACLHRLRHRGAVVDAAFSADGRLIATASEDRTAAVWDAATGARLQSVTHRGSVRHVDFDAHGLRILTASDDRTARVWNVATGKPVGAAMEHALGVLFASFSPDGARVVTASWSPTGRVWDAATGEPVTPPLDEGYTQSSARFSPDGRRVVTASPVGTVRVWDAATGRHLPPALHHARAVRVAAFAPDGHRLVTASDDGTVRLWDTARAQPRLPPVRQGVAVERLALSADDRLLATAGARGAARVWDAATAEAVTPRLRHAADVWDLDFSPDCARLATISWDRRARLWDAHAGALLHELELADRGWCVRFSPDGRLVVTTDGSGAVRLWSADTGAPAGFAARHRAQSRTAAFSPDGRLLASGGHDGIARIWRVADGKPVLPPLRHPGIVYMVSFSADGALLLTACGDGTARLWNVTTGALIRELAGHGVETRCARFSADGRLVVTASGDGTAIVWNAASGAQISSRMVHSGSISTACFGPRGDFVATASSGGVARVWHAGTGDPVTPPLRHAGKLRDIRFDSRGRFVVTGGDDGVARIWELPVDPRPVEVLAGVAKLLSGRRLDAHGSLGFLDRQTLRGLWADVRARTPEEFTAAPDEAVSWHLRELADCRRDRDWRTAIRHLDRLIEALPQRWRLYNERGYAHRMLGHWAQAAVDGATALRLRLEHAAPRRAGGGAEK